MSEFALPLAILAAYIVFVWYLWREGPAPARLEDPRERVLFVCTHNSARSQMAEAMLRHRAGSRFLVASAGTAPTSVHYLAERVMIESGERFIGHSAKAITEMGLHWDHVITVCDAAFENCPDFSLKTSRLHWSIADPSAVKGTEDVRLEAFRRVRDDLSQRIGRWISERAEGVSQPLR